MLVPRSIFEIVRCASTECFRNNIQGVNFQRTPEGKPIALATDGKCIAIVTWPEDPGEEYPEIGLDSTTKKPGWDVMVPTRACKDAMKATPAKSFKPILQNAVLEEATSNGKLRIGATDLDAKSVAEVQLIDKHPNIRGVAEELAALPKRATVKVNPLILAEVLTTLVKATGQGKEVPIAEIELPKDVEKPIRIRLVSRSSGIEATGYVMPIVNDSK